MSKFMRMIVFFDLPVQTKTERRHATAFRNFLLKDGYHMLQFSVYARVCNGNDAVQKHESRLRASLPPNGSIRLLVVTEKQYQSIQILLGNYQPEEAPFVCEQLSFF
ncbi:CRISPR-associated endonuclease Cas2 [Gemmiger formicilis]|jgi:CRISPR-associated protein Cas2|uniref:CRISPR-associated endonuclease Cas2 n=2 Tax=Gemmiger formicilis TaxID=745368 RepID=UPI001D0EEF4F|nr:CRISPR-associated endonuclease Cas2 [Gemmiger formicilis]MBS5472224.1 CRISPR-associated endonuclease Cas2 [Subdoligranulum variabile]MCC2193330.1 CRISPR-associated endonuclease Cas2 [Gemmiger formicilis]